MEKFSIFMIGAGGIVNDAHLPAYQLAGYKVEGIFDIDKSKAVATARRFHIPRVYDHLSDMIDAYTPGIVFDLSVPGSALIKVLEQIPEGSAVLMQKPMGNNLEEAKAVLSICRNRRLKAGVNFQLRYAPGRSKKND
jgi:predicted dehydrogenase